MTALVFLATATRTNLVSTDLTHRLISSRRAAASSTLTGTTVIVYFDLHCSQLNLNESDRSGNRAIKPKGH